MVSFCYWGHFGDFCRCSGQTAHIHPSAQIFYELLPILKQEMIRNLVSPQAELWRAYITTGATLAQLGERQTEVSQSNYLKALCSIHKSRIFFLQIFFFFSGGGEVPITHYLYINNFVCLLFLSTQLP